MSTAKAYSYIRFSTPEQSRGDSLRRQTKMAADYCARNKLTLDTDLTMQDLGVSAYRGKNLDGSGKLGLFMDAVKSGDVAPGSVLLLESLDRLTRQSARKAANIVGDIVDSGIDVVTLNDGKRYTKESFDDMDLIIAMLFMSRAHNESKEKGRRVAAAWAAKRARQAASGELLTSIVPGWIRVNEDGKRIAIRDRSAIVRRIFEAFLTGTGQESIAKALNADKVPPFGRAARWHKGYIAKILRARTVIGVMSPFTDSEVRTAQAPVEGYYPAVVDVETFERAQALLSTKAKAPGAKSTLATRNILAGLAKCPKCGGAMARVHKSKTKTAWLVCAAAKMQAGCKYALVRVGLIEAALQRTARDPLPVSDTSIGDALRNVEGGIEALDGIIEDLVAAVEVSASKALLAKLKAREEERDRLEVQRVDLAQRAEESDSKLVKRRMGRYRDAMTAKPFDPAAANVALREMVNKVVVDYDRQALQMYWRHDGVTEIVYDF